MYSYTFDSETGGLLLNSTPTNFSKEPRPVYAKEMDILGFDEYWDYPKVKNPLLWAIGRRYYYKGQKVKVGLIDTAFRVIEEEYIVEYQTVEYETVYETVQELKKQGYKDLTLTATVQEGQTATVQQTLEKDFSSEGRTFTVNGVTFEMIPVEGGTFRMGSIDFDAYSNESPIHSVTLSNYSIGKYEVTQALWQAVMGSNPSNFKGDNLPVEQVSWHDCQTFISKLNQLTGQHFRLPTEAEWEYAARGGNRSQGYKYSGSNTIGDVAWYNSNSNMYNKLRRNNKINN